ncbi:intradiol ring-cleavage dioxygenase [Sphingorhabdus lacus]|uniref:Hydroxyquinol 1,2-dioxygenase n=1 Tax=Sphingorhabdus lacus TaxID=392610 RepID=A0A6I6L247_9SPHN|nr:intradiol ring-cleavage dioxygenase [Sphingorhabdus lacus]QGY79269.1 hydroxyquinol 1,2-dioxygenase [Sphingorhabdus lacus]
MSDFEEQKITPAVLESFGETPDPRLHALVESLTRHLHAFVRETQPTQEEWAQGIEFLTAVGQKCDNVRQEFILLSDVLGVSMLVDAVNRDIGSAETDTTVLGPFFVENSPIFAQGADISSDIKGDPLYADVLVRSVDGYPLKGAKVEVWQSDAEGFYDVQRPGIAEGFSLRGTFSSDEDGRVRFWSILPTAYPIPHDGPVGALLKATGRHPWRPAHLHFKLSAAGYQTIVTHLFVKGDPYLKSDAVFGVKDALVCNFPRHAAGNAPDGRKMETPWHTLGYEFALAPDRNM